MYSGLDDDRSWRGRGTAAIIASAAAALGCFQTLHRLLNLRVLQQPLRAMQGRQRLRDRLHLQPQAVGTVRHLARQASAAASVESTQLIAHGGNCILCEGNRIELTS